MIILVIFIDISWQSEMISRYNDELCDRQLALFRESLANPREDWAVRSKFKYFQLTSVRFYKKIRKFNNFQCSITGQRSNQDYPSATQPTLVIMMNVFDFYTKLETKV